MNEEELRAMIRAELEDHDRRHLLAPRAPSTITDPDTGKQWITGALDKRELVKFAAWCISSLAGLVFAGLILFAKVEVYPEVDQRIRVHSTQARAEMEMIQPRFATAEQLAALRSEVAVSRAERVTRDEAIMERLGEIMRRLDRIEGMRGR